jgi:hypothetical protein
MVVQVLINQSQKVPLRESGVGVYAWVVRSRLGGDTSTASDLTPHWLMTNLLRQNS